MAGKPIHAVKMLPGFLVLVLMSCRWAAWLWSGGASMRIVAVCRYRTCQWIYTGINQVTNIAILLRLFAITTIASSDSIF